MKITRKSMLSGIEHSMEIDVTEAQLAAWKASGALVQWAFPNLTDDEREFLLSGVTAEEWDAAFPDEE